MTPQATWLLAIMTYSLVFAVSVQILYSRSMRRTTKATRELIQISALAESANLKSAPQLKAHLSTALQLQVDSHLDPKRDLREAGCGVALLAITSLAANVYTTPTGPSIYMAGAPAIAATLLILDGLRTRPRTHTADI